MVVGFLYLSISILCSITVSILLKKITYKKTNVSGIILINYVTATFLSLFFFEIYNEHLFPIINNSMYILLLIGCLLPLGFISMAQSIKYFGIAKSEVFQRMSVAITIIASFTIFNDKPDSIKIIYTVTAILSIFLLLDKQQKYISEERTYVNFIWPVFVCLTYGIADILFKKISSNISLTSGLFISFLVSAVVMVIYIIVIKHFIFNRNVIINGLIIGILNWTNIFSYIKAHTCLTNMPSTVFIVMNLGVVISGTVVGLFLFKEKLNKNNILGIFMAISSIILSISIRQ